MAKIDNSNDRRKGRGSDKAIFEGITPIICIFCKHITCIEFDLDLHLYQNHRMELINLPIGKGSLDFRIKYTIEEGKKVGDTIQTLSKELKEKLGFGSV